MPVARGPQISAKSAIIVGIAGVAAALLLGAGVIWLAGSGGNVTVRIGDTDFDAGSSQVMAEEIADNGPLLFADVGGGRRDIIVQHLGDDASSGWFAFEARPADQPRGCFYQWDPTTQTFNLTGADSSIVCPDITVDATGEGAGQFPVVVDDGGSVRVDINFNSEDGP